MQTHNNYVKQCSCCSTRFSQFSFPAIDAEHKDELDQLMRSVIRHMKLKGKFELICIEGFVSSFYYEYANAREELVCRHLCNRLYDIACDFYEMQLGKRNLLQAFE